MEYKIKASSKARNKAAIRIKSADIGFGITPDTKDELANPAEIFIGSLAACILKSVERMSVIMKFEYSKAEISINAKRLEKPPRMDTVYYKLTIYSSDNKLNLDLLKKNIEQYGTIYNTVSSACSISGDLSLIVE